MKSNRSISIIEQVFSAKALRKLAIASGILVVLFYILKPYTDGLDIDAIEEVWQSIDVVFLIPAALLLMFSLKLRGYRWALLFIPSFYISSSKAYYLSSICLTLNAMLPGKVGELYRIYRASKLFGTGIIFSSTTVVVERLFDLLALMLLLFASLFFVPKVSFDGWGDYSGSSRIFIPAILLIALLILIMSRVKKASIKLALQKLTGSYPVLARTWARLYPAINVIKSLGLAQAMKTLFFSLFIWLLVATAFYLSTFSITGFHVTYAQVVALTCISIFGTSMPAVPGGWGLFEGGVVISLIALGVEQNTSVHLAYAVAIHALSIFITIIAGFYGYVRLSSNFSEK